MVLKGELESYEVLEFDDGGVGLLVDPAIFSLDFNAAWIDRGDKSSLVLETPIVTLRFPGFPDNLLNMIRQSKSVTLACLEQLRLNKRQVRLVVSQ